MVKLVRTKNEKPPEYFSGGKPSPGGSLCMGFLVPSAAHFRKGVTQASGAFGKPGGGDALYPAPTWKRGTCRGSFPFLVREALTAAGPPGPSLAPIPLTGGSYDVPGRQGALESGQPCCESWPCQLPAEEPQTSDLSARQPPSSTVGYSQYLSRWLLRTQGPLSLIGNPWEMLST